MGRGSAVLIELPSTPELPAPVGIVDCFCGPNKEAPLLKKLDTLDRSSQGRLSIEFLVLTHLHADHFFGVSEVIKRFRRKIKKYYDPGIDPREVMAADHRTLEEYDTRCGQELIDINDFKEKNAKRIYSLTGPGMPIYSDEANQIRVVSVAPQGSMLNSVRKSLRRYIYRLRDTRADENLPAPDESYDLNRTSSAIEIGFSDIRVVLGGDVLTPTWNTVLPDGVGIGADVVLLSHHGATNAFPRKQWNKLQKVDGHSIVSGKGTKQPALGVLRYLRSSGIKVWATNVPAANKSDSSHAYVLFAHYGVDTRLPIKQGDVICDMSDELKITGPRIF